MRAIERRWAIEPIEIRDEGDKGIVARGYAAVFNSLSSNLGGFVEMVNPKAFNKTIQEQDVLALRDHNPSFLLGRMSSGTLRLEVDDHGLRYEIDLPNTTEGRDTAELLRRGDLKGSSFSFRAIEDSWGETPDGFPLRELSVVSLRDVGPVSFPAYPDTEVALRSLATEHGLDFEAVSQAARRNDLRALLKGTEETVTEEVEDEDRAKHILAHERRLAHFGKAG